MNGVDNVVATAKNNNQNVASTYGFISYPFQIYLINAIGKRSVVDVRKKVNMFTCMS